jgi:hypothetical protein
MDMHFRRRRPGEPRWSLVVRDVAKDEECEICHRRFGEHEWQEFSDHFDQIAEKQKKRPVPPSEPLQ